MASGQHHLLVWVPPLGGLSRCLHPFLSSAFLPWHTGLRVSLRSGSCCWEQLSWEVQGKAGWDPWLQQSHARILAGLGAGAGPRGALLLSQALVVFRRLLGPEFLDSVTVWLPVKGQGSDGILRPGPCLEMPPCRGPGPWEGARGGQGGSREVREQRQEAAPWPYCSGACW